MRESTSTLTYSFLNFLFMKKKSKSLDDEDFIPSLEVQRDYILSIFDFEYVSHIMSKEVYKDSDGNYKKYEILNSYTGYGVPSAEVLAEIARDLMNGAIQVPDSTFICRRGPFRVIKVFDRLILDFVLKSESYD